LPGGDRCLLREPLAQLEDPFSADRMRRAGDAQGEQHGADRIEHRRGDSRVGDLVSAGEAVERQDHALTLP
jgi:hypothetical protein